MKRTILLLLMIGSSLSFAATHYVVPTNSAAAPPYTNWTIAGTNLIDVVNVATSGVVLVSNGTYVLTNQVSVQTNIIIRSVNGRAVTIVDGNGPITTNRCFYLRTNDVLDGFTVQNGYAPNTGGGIYCDGARIINCRIANNFANSAGGGIDASYSQIINCQVTGNVTTNGAGMSAGGIYANKSLIFGCEVSSNINDRAGAGSCFGGGIASRHGSMISNCTIFANRIISTGDAYGGGVAAYENATICNSLIYGNKADMGGGGVWFNTYSTTVGYEQKIQNCTVVSNYSSTRGGGIRITCAVLSTACVENVISYYNTGGTTSNLSCDITLTGTYTFVNCCIAPTSSFVTTNATIIGNIQSDPMFVDKNTGNWRLSSSSPGINTGANQGWMTGAVDLDGRLRLDKFSGQVDMGCYEHINSGTFYGFR